MGLNSNSGISPIFLISLFEFSSLPIGTSSKARLGNELSVLLQFHFLFLFENSSSCLISFDIFF